MGIRNGKQFLAMLDDAREVWLDGKRVESVADWIERASLLPSRTSM